MSFTKRLWPYLLVAKSFKKNMQVIPKPTDNEIMVTYNNEKVIFKKAHLDVYLDLAKEHFWVCHFCKRAKRTGQDEVVFWPKDNRITFEQANDNETKGNQYYANLDYSFLCCTDCY